MKKALRFIFSLFVLILCIDVSAQIISVTYPASGTFVVPCGVTSVTVDVWGAGGGGAGDGTNTSISGGGGGGGGYSSGTVVVTPGSSIAVTVGTGGAGGAGNANGTAGGTSTFSTVSATGGGGGGYLLGAAGAAGTGTTTNGTAGAAGVNPGAGGTGGDAGGGGTGGVGAVGSDGGAGTGPGGGGAGGDDEGGGTRNGGAGADGLIIVTYTITSAGLDQTLTACSTTTSLNATVPSSGTGTWTCVSGCTGVTITTPTSATSGVTGLDPGVPTTFAWTVSNAGCTSTVDQVIVNSPTGAGCWDYCTPTQDGGYPVTNVTFNTINNSNAGTGTPYQNFNGMCTQVFAGSTYNISVSATGLSPNPFNIGVYFDWNNNGSYADAGEFYDLGSATTTNYTLNMNITIPAGATTGTTSFIVYNQYNVDAGPCQATGSGQAESYCVTILCAPGTCSDGIQNNCETAIDCGGPNCTPCAPTCTDGIQNQGEDAVDCGGPCGPCTFTHPTSGINNTYVGNCMVNTCTGTYTDDGGGGGGNYSNNVGNFYRVFCPDVAGNCMQLSFTSIDMHNSTCIPGNVPCDVLSVEDGSTQNNTVLAQVTYLSDGTTPVYTATNASGCLTVQFSSNAGNNAPGWSANLSCVPCAATSGLPQTNDCVNSTGVCSNATINAVSYGPGLTSESCTGCTAGGENYSLWYNLQISASGTLGLTIDPTQGNDDYDFALYGPNAPCSSLGTPIRCSYSAALNNTGMGNGATDVSEDVSGNGWVSTLNVTAGETYILMVNHWTPPASNQGFSLIWNLTNGASLDCVVLPVGLTKFTGDYINDVVHLKWETSSETNNDFFTIERSKNGVDFELVGSKDGAGNSNTTLYYDMIDTNPFEGTSYYRLKQTNLNGSFEYSGVIAVSIKSVYEDVSVYPNPVTGDGYLSFNSTSDEDQTVFIYDIAGKLVYQKLVEISMGNNNLTLETSNLTQGMYFIQLGNARDGINTKFIKE